MSAIGDTLRNNFPVTLSKDGKVFKHIVANPEIDVITDENIDKCGLLERMLYRIQEMGKMYSQNTDVYEWDPIMFERLAKFFCTDFLKYKTKQFMQDEMELLFNREGRKQWGTPLDIGMVFKMFFSGADSIYMIDESGAAENNLILNPDFNDGQDNWTLAGTTISIGEVNPFCGSQSPVMKKGDSVTQTITLEPGLYDLHYFYIGKVDARINADGKDWNGTSWVTPKAFIHPTRDTDKYRNNHISFSITTRKTINIIFECTKTGSEVSLLDHIRLFKYENPHFTVIARYLGTHKGKKTVISKDGGNDPLTGVNYEEKGYLNNSYLEGVSDSFTDEVKKYVLDYLRPVGINADIEIVNKESNADAFAYVVDTTLVMPYGFVDDTTLNSTKSVDETTLKA